MSEKTTPDTVPGLGFKDKEKAVETLKNLEGRDPDYQKLAIKGLIGRAKRTLLLTKAEDKVQNIKDAVSVFEEWLKTFEKLNLGKDNRSYLPLATVKLLLPLKDEYEIECEEAEDFLSAYDSVGGDYKHLRTVASGENKPTWDIVRNACLKQLLKDHEDDQPDLWENDLPTKEHLKLIVWAYSPDASKIKKSLPKLEEKLGKNKEGNKSSDSDSDDGYKLQQKRSSKRKSSESDGSSSDEDTPKKKSKK